MEDYVSNVSVSKQIKNTHGIANHGGQSTMENIPVTR